MGWILVCGTVSIATYQSFFMRPDGEFVMLLQEKVGV